jgi:F0F1-type ATP synthase membrane subunit b/b'
MSIVQIVVLTVIVLILLVIFVCFCLEEAQRSRMKARAARYDAGVEAAMRISEKACELEQQIYAEAIRHRKKSKSIRDKP